MSRFFYKSEAPAAVSIVVEFYTAKDELKAAMVKLGELIGGAIAPMHDITSHFAGGVKLSSSRELDVHWCRPDDYGFRKLRTAAKPPKGTPKEVRVAIRNEHERLLNLWRENCPQRLCSHHYWERLGINTGNLMLSGGIKFELNGWAYFNLGFPIDEIAHLEKEASGKPSYGWIDGAVEILPSEYEAARALKLKAKETENA
ncbi:hypothetical protein [Pseudomonas sp.]|uniref:hypothetical protein n=1 Tax=Pseudomonas sp. TaxID=306 RepID=UPI00257CB4B3|nr:hypothetical protein [Pseudomonas sp.]